MGLRFAIRDGAIFVAAVIAWIFATSAGAETNDFWQITAGVLGGLCGYFLHEWGHTAGAAASGSRYAFSSSLWTLFLFRYDVPGNRKEQFLTMSLSGFAASFIVLGLVFALFPLGLLATKVMLGILLASLALTLFIEVPLLVYVMRGGQPPKTGVFTLPE